MAVVAVGWAIAGIVGIMVASLFNPMIQSPFGAIKLNLASLDSAETIATVITAGLSSAMVGAVAGALGGGVTVWQISKLRTSGDVQGAAPTMMPARMETYIRILGLPALMIVIGWGMSRGVAQALLSADTKPQGLVWFMNWVLGGAIGGAITGLALQRVEPKLRWKHIWIIAGGWAGSWALSWMLVDMLWQFLSDLSLGAPDLPGFVGTAVGGGVGGAILAAVWRGVAPRLRERPVWLIAGGWAVGWAAANSLANQIQNDQGWVVGWSIGGLVTGLIGAMAMFWQWQIAQTDVERPSARPIVTPRPTPITTNALWLPIGLTALGWGIARGIGHGIYLLFVTIGLPEDVFSGVLDSVSWVLGGAIGGAMTGLALRRIEPAFGWKSIWMLAGGWAGAWAVSQAVTFGMWTFVDELGVEVRGELPSTIGLAIGGAIGGYLLAAIWRGLFERAWHQRQMWIIAGGWAVGLIVANLIRWGIIGTEDANSAAWLLGWSLGGLVAGLIGGAVTFWQLHQPQQP